MHATPPQQAGGIIHHFDDLDLPRALAAVAEFDKDRYGFVVTPNVDHLIRCHEDASFREIYGAATFVLLDSRVVARILRLFRGLTLPVCPGSDLTAALFSRVIRPSDRIVMIGGTAEQAQMLVRLHGLTDLKHHDPPMGFIRDSAALELCLQAVEDASPFRFCFLAVGSPQQEVLAHALWKRGRARGLALCVGGSLNFLTGVERRAPTWMQQAGLEWLYRLLQAPRRLGYRYLVRGPRFFTQMFRSSFALRQRAFSHGRRTEPVTEHAA
jgi:exopolysaccharide biosynthesis WecB/TagA/CpsF family protein